MARPRAALMAVCISVLWSPLFPASQDRAAAILHAAREAIGGDARLSAVTSLSLKATSVAEPGSRRIVTDLRIDIELPDKFLVRQEWPMAFTRRFGGFNGRQLIERRQLAGVWSEETFGDGGKQARRLAARRREYLRYLLCWLLATPDEYGLHFSHAASAQGEERTDAIEAKGVDDFAARLLFDRTTHRLLTVTYREPPAVAPTDDCAKAEASFTRIEGAEPAENSIQLERYRRVEGILLPHLMKIEADGLLDEWRISRFRLNGPIEPKLFDPK